MPSYSQLEAEPWWGREIVTDELDWLGDELCGRTGRPRDAFGSKGNNVHLNGGHRSQEWILNSDWCTNTMYTVQPGLTAAQLRHIAAGDFTPGAWGTAGNRALMAKHTRALFDAARAGQLAGVRQIFGTLDGVRATGLNVLSNSTTTPDSSHLDHLHLTFDRRHMRDKALMTRIADIITGDDMPTGPEVTSFVWDWGPAPDGYNMRDHMLNAERSAAKALALVEKLLEESGIDPEELEAIKAAASAGAEAGVARGADELAAALAPLLELDEAKVKAALAEVLGQARITVVPAQ